MGAGKTQMRVCSTILAKNGKFAILIHDGDGTPICQSDFRFSTMDEAKAAGTEILNRGMARMKEEGFKVRRPG
jgi:hypothetical protein